MTCGRTKWATRRRGFRVAAITASREHRLTSGCGLFGLEAFVLVDDGPLDPLSSWPVRGTLQHPDFGVVLGGEAAENHYVYVLGIHRNVREVFAEFHFRALEIHGEPASLLEAARAVVLYEP